MSIELIRRERETEARLRGLDVSDIVAETHAREDRIVALEAEVERLRAPLRTLLGMHDAEVFVREPWDITFDEVRVALAAKGDEDE